MVKAPASTPVNASAGPGSPVTAGQTPELGARFAPELAALRGKEFLPLELLRALDDVGLVALRETLVQRGYAPIVATDLDGTVWSGDVGEAMFKRAISQRLLLPAAQAPLSEMLGRYEQGTTQDPHRDAATLLCLFESGELTRLGARHGMNATDVARDFYAINAACFAGRTPDELRAFARELFASGFAELVFPGCRELLIRLQRAGFTVWAVSASCQWFIEAAAPFVGIDPKHCLGFRLTERGGRVGPELVPPLTFGPGKVEALLATFGEPPAISMGDSVLRTDKALLASAALQIAVEPSGEHLAAAHAARLPILRYR